LDIRIACVADFTLMSKMSRIRKNDWLVSFSFDMLVENKWAVGMDFKRPLNDALFWLDF
jgi:hypothetical protein